MDLEKFYFTYGSDDVQPYCGGWTEVWAPNYKMACQASTKKVHSCILLPGIMLRLQGNFTTQFSSVSMGFAQREGHLREKFFLTAYLAQF